MIVFNGKKFAKNDDEMTSSLFNSGGTCLGFYKKVKNGIQLLDLQKNIFAFISNKEFVVSASRQTDKRIRYMFSTSTQDDKLLGLDDIGYKAMTEECRGALCQA